MEQKATLDQKTPSPKKPYTTPTLVEYGDVTKLTQGSPSGRFPDGMPGMFMAMCL
ncbi:MAG: lasso RiPP family leader peptide-containing protein [Nitrospira sp.]|nr:lasso RiPP family leader peptide-containing protein [Nitrospira sp.]